METPSNSLESNRPPSLDHLTLRLAHELVGEREPGMSEDDHTQQILGARTALNSLLQLDAKDGWTPPAGRAIRTFTESERMLIDELNAMSERGGNG